MNKKSADHEGTISRRQSNTQVQANRLTQVAGSMPLQFWILCCPALSQRVKEDATWPQHLSRQKYGQQKIHKISYTARKGPGAAGAPIQWILWLQKSQGNTDGFCDDQREQQAAIR